MAIGGVYHGTCNLCEAICGINVTATGATVQRITGDHDDPLSNGYICPKSVALIDIHADPDRLRRPMRRRGNTWEEIDWATAIDYTASELARIQLEHGRDSVGAFFGNPVVHSLGAMTHGTVLSSLLRTHNRYSATSTDQLPHQVVSYLLYGHQLVLPEPDLERTRYLLIFGANPLASNGSMMTAPGMNRRLREIRERGGRVVVVDPRRTETAVVADEHLFIRPGTDAVVLLAMVNVALRREPLAAPDYLSGMDQLRSVIADFTPEAASRCSGIPAEVIERIALEFAEARGAACYGRIGVSTQRFGTVCHWAIQLLNIVTGNLGREGGTLVPDPAVEVTKLASPGGPVGRFHSRVRGLPSFSGELPVAALAEEITTPGAGQIRGLVTVSGNPVLSTPGGAKLDQALRQLEFMVAVDFYLNETTRHATVILPPTSSLEREHYDLIFRAFAVRNTAKYSPALFPKPDDARHDWEIFRDLGLAYQRAMAGSRSSYLASRLMPRHATAEARLRLSPRAQVDLLLRTGPYSLSVPRLLAQPSGLDLGPLQPGMKRHLHTPDKRIQLVPALIVDALQRLRVEVLAEEAGTDRPLRLIGRRHMRSNNSWMHNYGRLNKGKPRHHLLMHPHDADRHGLVDGPAVLRSAAGSILVEVEQTEDIMEGTVSLPHGFGHDRPDTHLTVANTVAGTSINDVTDPDWLDESCGNAAFCGLPVTVEAAPVTASAR